MKIKILFAGFLALVLFITGYAQTPDKAKLDRFFDRLAEKNKAMGSLTVTREDKILYTRVIGYSQINGTEKKPASAATRYRIGSVTKIFTAALIFQLIEEGKLKLSDTLDKFFPQVPNAGKITIAHLLAHRSGIYDLTEDRDYRSWKMQPKTKAEVIAIIAKSQPRYEPGEKVEYSNSGFALLGYIVEKLAGKPYQDALKERITVRLALKDTYLGTGSTDAGKNESYSYNFLGDWKQETETHPSIPGGAGAIISTPNDLAKFIQALFDGKIVSQESLASMTQNKFGLNTFQLAGKTFYGHTGGIDNFGAWLVYLPEEKPAVAYTANARVYPLANIVSGVFDIYYNKPFEIPAFETINVSPEVLDTYAGVYSTPQVPLKLTITREGSTLLAQSTGQPVLPLEATAQDKFKIESRGIVLEFDAAKKQLTFKRGGQEIVFTKEN